MHYVACNPSYLHGNYSLYKCFSLVGCYAMYCCENHRSCTPPSHRLHIEELIIDNDHWGQYSFCRWLSGTYGSWHWPLIPFWCHSKERVELYLYFPYEPYALYRASVPVQGCTFHFLAPSTFFKQNHMSKSTLMTPPPSPSPNIFHLHVELILGEE